jgi:hypothetical protein
MKNRNFPKFWNYGEYSSDNYGAHSMAFEDAEGNTFYFSYKTLVAFRPARGSIVVHTNDWGNTTGKHLNWIDGGDKYNRVNSLDFERLFYESFHEKMEVA